MAVIYGKTGADNITGTSGNDTTYGWARGNASSLSGSDTLYGGGGNDYLSGGDGYDRLYGEAGNDTLYGGGRGDYLESRNGNDQLYGEAGNDRLYAGTGNDILSGGDGNDYLLAEAGDDTLDSGLGNNTLSGGDGNDYLNAYNYTGNNTLNGGDGDDLLGVLYSTGNNTLSGSAGNDTMDTDYSTGNNTFLGGAGDDLLSTSGYFFYTEYPAFDKNDIVDGGTGTDTLRVGSSTSISINLAASIPNGTITVGISSVAFSSIEKFDISGYYYDDTLIGSNGNDTLNGGSGTDILTGLAGNDILISGQGDDTLTGGSGNDSFTYSDSLAFDSYTFGLDTITDFHKVADDTDKIALSKQPFNAITSNIGTGFSNKSEFAVVANNGAVAASQAFIVYSQGTGNLFYNQNGAESGLGTGDLLATLTNRPVLAATDFVLQAGDSRFQKRVSPLGGIC